MFLNDLWQSLDPVAFSVGPVTVRWYALAYILGVLVAAIGVRGTAKRWGLRIHDDAISIIMMSLVVGIILGARLGYVIAYGDGYYLSHPAEILATWKGGMSFHGGLVGAVVATWLACRHLGVNCWTYFDMLAIWAPAGLMMGRCANFVNGELWGKECDPGSIPWAVAFDSGGGVWRHPSQLYEAILEGAILLAVMLWLSRRRPSLPQCSFSSLFLAWYGTCRFLVEFVRVPDPQLGYLAGGWLTMGQVLSLPMVAIGVIWLRKALSDGVPQHAFGDGRDIGGGCDDVAGDILALAGTEDGEDEHDGNDGH